MKLNTISRESIEHKDMDESAYVRQQPWYKKAEVIVPLAMLGIGAASYLIYRCMPTKLPVENPIDPDAARQSREELIQASWEVIKRSEKTTEILNQFLNSP